MQPDGSYLHLNKRGKERLCAQAYFCEAALAVTESRKEKSRSNRHFEPLMHEEEEL